MTQYYLTSPKPYMYLIIDDQLNGWSVSVADFEQALSKLQYRDYYTFDKHDQQAAVRKLATLVNELQYKLVKVVTEPNPVADVAIYGGLNPGSTCHYRAIDWTNQTYSNLQSDILLATSDVGANPFTGALLTHPNAVRKTLTDHLLTQL